MFDFEKLDVYGVVEDLNVEVNQYLDMHAIEKEIADSWRKASWSSVLHLAEGVGRLSVEEKKTFLLHARGYIFQCVSLLRFLQRTDQLTEVEFDQFYEQYEKSSKMLLGMYRSLK